MISFNMLFNQEQCTDLSTALQREWLETNGIGGFASSTITGINTRRYHGLLVAATRPPVGRMVLLSKLEETLFIKGGRYDLSADQYPGVVHPQGHLKIKEFRLDPFPIYTYQVNGVVIEKRIFMVHGENTVVVEYELRAPGPNPSFDCHLELRPLIAFRDYHSLTHANSALDSSVEIEPGIAIVRPYRDLVALSIAHNGSEVAPTGDWYYNLVYQTEQERGLDDREDLFNPFVLHFNLGQRPTASVIASTEKHDVTEVARLRKAEIDRRSAWKAAPLVAAADQFVVKRGELQTVIAGYHWFGDWGRDTMIALPGLLLTTGRTDIAKEVLLTFSKYVDQGMLPNRFPDSGETPEYNTVDATLWFFDAIRALLESTGDYEFVRTRMYAVLVDIVEWHLRGTRYGIHADSDGLLACGQPGVQLTWMDAKIGDWVVTPRTGKPVEIQALWHNALRVMEQLAGRFGDLTNTRTYSEIADRARTTFEDKFWNAGEGCLYDVVNGEEQDGAIRPNQIFAVSLANPILSGVKARSVVEVVERELLTPYGLRTLSPRDSRYAPRYEGPPNQRDAVYHQGTVWAWLMGPFITAYLKVNGQTAEAGQSAMQLLRGFEAHLREAGLGQVSEIFDAEPPHRPRGCIAQAWSVGELLRVGSELMKLQGFDS